ncbi:VanZ family protein [Ruminococcaceae bacterium OttesenSCG-928-D13]|nr:VanZ family protein [Ruminococcaceae bacterium OttesenSCG-928-D13]
MEKHTKVRRAIAFYTPLVLYFGFIIVFLVTRFFLVYLITGNAYMNPQRLPRQYNLVPFATIGAYINPSRQRFAFLDVIGNILLFVPMGVYIHALSRGKKLWLSALLSLLSTVVIETAQFTLATGSFDIDDILMNFIGALGGVLIFHLIYRGCNRDAAASGLVLSAISVAVIPLLGATVLQYMLWIPAAVLVPACVVAFGAVDTALYFFLYRRESKAIRTVYLVSCIVLCFLFFAAVVPMVGP